MLHIDFDFSDPDDRGTVRALIDAYENRNADSKAADIPEPETIITQDEHLVQDEEIQQNSFFEPIWEPDVNEVLETHGLSFSDCPSGGSSSANKIGCKKFVMDNVDRLGLAALDKTLETLPQAYPYGGEKWNSAIINDVWNFYSRCEKAGIAVDKSKVIKYLSIVPRTDRPFTTDDFLKTITLIPGEATLNRYNLGFKEKNKVPRKVLTGGEYRYVTK